MKCPRCGGNMTSGVCDNCGFPVNRKVYIVRKSKNLNMACRKNKLIKLK